jgi:hypothetical protein
LFVIDAQPLIRWMFSVKLRVVAGPNIQNDLAKLLSGPQNAQGLAGGPQWIAGVDHRPQAMLRHCRQQCGELAGIARRRALNVRLADENPLQIGGFQKAAKARREFLQLRKCRDRAGSASGRVAVACRVRHGGRGPSPPLHDLENLGVEVFSQATHDGCVFRERGIADIDGGFQDSHSRAHS